jgi:hypothetical protein
MTFLVFFSHINNLPELEAPYQNTSAALVGKHEKQDALADKLNPPVTMLRIALQ